MFVPDTRLRLRDRRDRRGLLSPALALLPGLALPTQIGAGALKGSRGETLTFTRATSKYCAKADGSLVLLSSGQPAVEPGGLLIEAAHTNLCPNSQAFNQWGTADVNKPAVTANAALAPDGTMTADQLVFPAISAINPAYVYQNLTTSNAAHCQAIYLRADVPCSIYLFLKDSANTRFPVLCNITTSWQRFANVFTPAAGTSYFQIGAEPGVNGMTTLPACTIYVWQADVIAGSFSRSPILTAGATATCDADVASLPATRVPVSRGSVEFDFTPLWDAPGASKVLLCTQDGTHSNAGLQVLVTATGAIQVVTASTAGFDAPASSALAWTLGQKYKVALRWTSAGALDVYRGGALAIGQTGMHTPDYAGAAQLGSQGGASHCDGRISNLRFYPR